MKIIMVLLSLIALDKGCCESKINQDVISIEYAALSRGTYISITINKSLISVTNKRGAKPENKPCTEVQWKTLITLLKTVNIEQIPNLKAPSEKRFFDGAAIANLKITYKGTDYESASFDHGNPPEEIAPLVKEILSISENIE